MNQQQKLAQFRDQRRAAPAVDPVRPAPAGDASPPEPGRLGVPDDIDIPWALLSQIAMIGTGFVVAVLALYLARSIVMPVVAATIIGITLRPIQTYADEYRIPPVLTAALLVLLFFGGIYLAAGLVIGPLSAWVADAPELGSLIKEKFRWVERPLATLREFRQAMGDGAGSTNPTVAVETSLPSLLQSGLTIVTPAISEFLLFFGTLLFFLVGSHRMRRQLVTFFGTREARLRVLRIWNDVEQDLISYVGTVTVINIGLGILVSVALYLLGFPMPLAFGVLAAVLNYIPYIGPAIMVATLFAVGIVATPTLGTAAIPPLLFVAIATIEGHFITPSIVGRRLTLSPFLVFLALAFWTWLWGPFGAFLATPLLIVSLVLLSHLFPSEETTALPQ